MIGLRRSLVLTVFIVAGACRDAAAPARVVLLSDDFSGAYPGNWSQFPPPSSRGGNARDTVTGNPKPSLALTNFCRQIPFTDPALNICTPTASIVGNTTNFELGSSGKVSVAVDVLLSPLVGGGSGSAGVSIGSTSPNGNASVRISLEEAAETYSFCSAAAVNCSVVKLPFLPDGRFHTYRFVAAADGSRWERDGVIKLSANETLQGEFQIHLSAIGLDVAGAKREYPVAYFDNVLVTRQ